MEIGFLVDASPLIGHGHVMRCAAIADEVASRDWTPIFVPRGAYAKDLLLNSGLPVGSEEHAFDFAVIDYHSSIDPELVAGLKRKGSSIVFIDDRGRLNDSANLVCDAFKLSDRDMNQLENHAGRMLFGLNYAILRRQFREFHSSARPGRSDSPKVLVALGGVDPHQVSFQVAQALNTIGFRGPATFVVEEGQVSRLQAVVDNWSDCQVLSNVVDMAPRMAGCDLVVTKIGVTALEALCVGVGIAMIEPTRLHMHLSEQLASSYSDWPSVHLGLAGEVDFVAVAEQLLSMLENKEFLTMRGGVGSQLVDGKGVERIVNRMQMLRALP